MLFPPLTIPSLNIQPYGGSVEKSCLGFPKKTFSSHTTLFFIQNAVLTFNSDAKLVQGNDHHALKRAQFDRDLTGYPQSLLSSALYKVLQFHAKRPIQSALEEDA